MKVGKRMRSHDIAELCVAKSVWRNTGKTVIVHSDNSSAAVQERVLDH